MGSAWADGTLLLYVLAITGDGIGASTGFDKSVPPRFGLPGPLPALGSG
ncbi:hypothetical protein AB0425_39785 [Actinosynnema sp. NPDC051121]